MKRKYVHWEEIDKEISHSYGLIDTLEKEIEREKKRVEYLKVLLHFCECHRICPFVNRELLKNDVKLQDYVMPFLVTNPVIAKCVNMEEILRKYSSENAKEYHFGVPNISSNFLFFPPKGFYKNDKKKSNWYDSDF